MKRMFLALALVASMFGALNAQVKENVQVKEKAIGLRFAFGAELSYLHPLGKDHRLEFDLGYNSFGHNLAGHTSWGTSLSGIYQWVWDLSDLADGFNWYAGAGGAILTHSSFFGTGVLGQVGIEYNFKFPLQLSVDYRPAIYLIPGTDNVTRSSFTGACLSARYRF
jgi:hypothetical protein